MLVRRARTVLRRSPFGPQAVANLSAIEATYHDLARLAEVTPEQAHASQRALKALLAGRQRASRAPDY